MEPPQLVLAGGWRTMAKARIAWPLAYRSPHCAAGHRPVTSRLKLSVNSRNCSLCT
jgi:hypothetical protein